MGLSERKFWSYSNKSRQIILIGLASPLNDTRKLSKVEPARGAVDVESCGAAQMVWAATSTLGVIPMVRRFTQGHLLLVGANTATLVLSVHLTVCAVSCLHLQTYLCKQFQNTEHLNSRWYTAITNSDPTTRWILNLMVAYSNKVLHLSTRWFLGLANEFVNLMNGDARTALRMIPYIFINRGPIHPSSNSWPHTSRSPILEPDHAMSDEDCRPLPLNVQIWSLDLLVVHQLTKQVALLVGRMTQIERWKCQDPDWRACINYFRGRLNQSNLCIQILSVN